MRRIKNSDNLMKEDLIISLLKSESSHAERNFERLFNNNTDDNDTYDDKIRDKISDIRMKQKKRKTFQISKKKRIMIILSN